ncbi:MAG: hypothetical protein AAF489_13830 [Bacteroidota bacterium]
MKFFLTLLLFPLCAVASAQNKATTLVYEKTYQINDGGLHKRQLSLHSDGTFVFHSYRKIKTDSPDENSYGKGTWASKKDLYIFSADRNSDFDEKYTLDFDKSRARIFKDGSIKFLNSAIFWVKGMPLDRKK